MNWQREGSTVALATVKRGTDKTTDNSGLDTGSGQPGDPGDRQAACLTPPELAYKDLIAKSGTTTLSPTIQQDFTGQKQLTLARHILQTRLSPIPKTKQQPGDVKRDIRQVDLDGSVQLPMATCGAWAIIAECESGQHHFAKRLYCGREWCDVCGQDNSASHKRRQARLLPKLQQVKQVGYFVIEFPDSVRHIGERGISPDSDNGEIVSGWCYSKTDLRDTTNTIVDVLAGKRGAGGRGSKRVGGYFARGIARWHWFGDKKPGKYNPHLNVLVDFDSLGDSVRGELQPVIESYRASLSTGKQTKRVRRELQGIDMFLRGKSGYMPKPLLDRIQTELRESLNCRDLIVHYEWRDSPGKIVHSVRYITRATFRDSTWDAYMAEELYNFRNIRWWGSWQGESAWQLEQAKAEGENVDGLETVSKLQAGVCPDCGQPLRVLHHSDRAGEPVHWSQPIDSTFLLIWGAKEIAGTGYYRIPSQVRSGTVFSPGEILRLQELRAGHRFDAVHRLGRSPDDDELRHKVNRLKLDKLKAHRGLSAAMWFGFSAGAEDDDDEIELPGRANGDGLVIRPKDEAGGDGE